MTGAILNLASSVSADVPTNVWFTLENRASGLVADISGRSPDRGAELIQYRDTGGSHQQFRFLDSGSDHYWIQARHTGQVLDLSGGDTENGASIVQWDENGGENQQWRVERASAGYYTLVNRRSGKALDVWRKSKDPGSRISQYTLTGNGNQQWKLVPVDADFIVARDGSGTHATVQSAINAASSGDSILIRPGVYNEHVEIPASKGGITLIGSTGRPDDVVIVDFRCASCSNSQGGQWGTARSATAIFYGADLYVRDLSIVNSYNEAAYGSSQAVALSASGDRQIYENVRIIGNQDTLLTWSAGNDVVTRQYFRDCYVEGDVDFIFGRGSTVFDRCTIHSLDRGSNNNNGFITAASTELSNHYGILIYHCTITSDAAAGTVYLGRPWPAGGSRTAIGQVLVRESWLDEAIRADAWTDMAGLSWRDARLSEYGNYGPGALVNGNRPQINAEQAAFYTPRRYLAGADHWNPLY